MKDTVNVRLVTRYKFEDEKTREMKTGTTITCECESITNNDTKIGYDSKIIKSENYGDLEDFRKGPGIYDLDVELKPLKGGKYQLVYISKSAKFISEAPIV